MIRHVCGGISYVACNGTVEWDIYMEARRSLSSLTSHFFFTGGGVVRSRSFNGEVEEPAAERNDQGPTPRGKSVQVGPREGEGRRLFFNPLVYYRGRERETP